ncbi:MAG: hypothetical protein A2167_00040 [Planctomycetes bacterium RBG_13_46_10]|nr:MAG: hypothetical protein A2167_00040 [Planctomycetes bacterium RBG_13_46_10]
MINIHIQTTHCAITPPAYKSCKFIRLRRIFKKQNGKKYMPLSQHKCFIYKKISPEKGDFYCNSPHFSVIIIIKENKFIILMTAKG